MNTGSLLKKDWEVTAEAFEKLLNWLDPDRRTAGIEYENIRRKLIKLFEWRNCRPAEEYADITINRVTRRIFEGASVDVGKPYLYFHGTAVNVLREYWRKRQRFKKEEIERFPTLEASEKNPEELINEKDQQKLAAGKYDCMRRCIAELPAVQQKLIIRYHHGKKIREVRKKMAREMDVPINVLRIRACRIRNRLKDCAERCVEEKM